MPKAKVVVSPEGPSSSFFKNGRSFLDTFPNKRVRGYVGVARSKPLGGAVLLL